MAETQRFCNLVSVNVFHRTTKDTEIRGYKIPESTVITHQVSTVLMDERYFPEPETFKPERFLDKNGKFFQPVELIPFGVGKRACLGEGLARLELFLFAANIANQFKVSLSIIKIQSPVSARLSQKPNQFCQTRVGGTVVPSPFLCTIENRY